MMPCCRVSGSEDESPGEFLSWVRIMTSTRQKYAAASTGSLKFVDLQGTGGLLPPEDEGVQFHLSHLFTAQSSL